MKNFENIMTIESTERFENIVKENVSRETFSLIQSYVNLLLLWNKKVNLISRNLTQNELYGHIYETILLSKIIPNKDKIIVDVGTGSGIPGVVLAALGYKAVHMIEMNRKKSAFLREIIGHFQSNSMNTNSIYIHNQKVENIKIDKTDYIISKAMTTIEHLFYLTQNLTNNFTGNINKFNNSNLTESIQTNSTFIVFKTKDQLKNELNFLNKNNFRLQEYVNPYRTESVLLYIQPCNNIID